MYRSRLVVIFLVSCILLQSCRKEDEIFNPDVTYGSVKDVEGNGYRTVVIGNQVWMAENLRTTLYHDGAAIEHVAESSHWSSRSGFYCWYGNDGKSARKGYGALYNWTAVESGKLCPGGWHVPEIEEWKTLENYLIANHFNYDGSTTGNQLARSLSAVKYWETSTEPGSPGYDPVNNNTSGFSALPSGYRDPTHGWNTFNGAGTACGWWSSTPVGSSYALHAGLNYGSSTLHIDDPGQLPTTIRSYGFSIRCVKND